MLSLGIEMPPEIKEEFNELYSIVSEFPDFPLRNLRCFDCKKIPMITINYDKLSVRSLCEGDHFRNINMRDYYKIFSDERNEIRVDICSVCSKENEFYPEVNYKFCKECNKILCKSCEKEHIQQNPEHILDNKLLNPDSSCIEHKLNFSHFCEECFKNLCENCLENHNKLNIGHNLKRIEKINDKIIACAKKKLKISKNRF